MQSDWVEQVMRYWFDELRPEAWFRKDPRVDDAIHERFAALHDEVAQLRPGQLATPRACLAAVIVLDQFSRNMYRATPSAFGNDAKALAIAQKAIAKSFAGALSSDEQLFLYLPFEHQENVDAQARSVELISALGDAELTNYAQAHKAVIDRFGRFPRRNAILGRTSTAEELEFLMGQGSSF